MDPKLNKKFPDCANEALILIRTNYNRIGKQELLHLAYEFIFFYDFNKEQNSWIKVCDLISVLLDHKYCTFITYLKESKSHAGASMCRLYNELPGD